MAWTQSDIDALKAAVARGVKRVTFADQTTEFHTLDEMRSLLADMEHDVSDAPTRRLARFSKGTC